MNSEKINSILQYASVHVPYYKRLFEEKDINFNGRNARDCFNDIPVLNKDIVLNNTDAFISDEFKKEELDVDRTSGSTGKILNIYWNSQDRIRSLMSLWSARKILHNILPTSKCCYFHSIAYRTENDLLEKDVFSPRIMIRENGLILSLSKLRFDEKTLEVYYKKIFEFNPEWIMCHPSTLHLFADFIEKTNKKRFNNLRLIELTGEYLMDSYRKKISDIFEVKIANHYGAREVNGIAYECKNGHMHCLDNNVYVEIINENKNVGYDKVGQVCITGLNNRSMPFIRYNLEDVAILRKGETCGCGNLNPYLEIHAGRGNDVIKLNNGKSVECVVFFYVIEYINAHFKNIISQFQVIRVTHSKFEIMLVLLKKSEDIFSKIEFEFIEKVSEYGFSDCEWKFSFVDIIPPQQHTQKLNFYYDKSKQHNTININ